MTSSSSSGIRRIVTGFDANGKSTIESDGPPPSIKTVKSYKGFVSANIWRTTEAPASYTDQDSTPQHSGVLPPQNGTILRVIDYPPENRNPEIAAREAHDMFTELYPDATRNSDKDQPAGMHATETVDYAIVIEGEIHAVLEQGETLMRAGDILIQRGTRHSWSNRSDGNARVVFVLISGKQ
ncbi:cupin domain-containing protein [Burkholderia stagnalis]